jgi:hypothetical protein
VDVFALWTDADRISGLMPVDEDDLDLFIDGFCGESMTATWPEPEVEPRDPDLPLTDFAGIFGAVIAYSERAVEALGPVVQEHGEWLALRGLPYSVFNTLALADVLDREASDADYFAPDRVLDLRRLVLQSPAVHVPPIFKLPEWKKGRSLITQPFLDVVNQSDLRGLLPVRLTAT